MSDKFESKNTKGDANSTKRERKSPFLSLPDGISLMIYVQPGAAQSGFSGEHDGYIKIKVKARAVDGEANQAVIALLAKYFSLPKSSISITRGHVARKKTVFIAGNSSILEKQCRLLTAL